MAHSRALYALALALPALHAAPAMANSPAEDAMPRIEDPLCPGVSGLATGAALQVLERVRYNAERLDMRLADPETCSLNLLIAFVEDGQKAVATLMKSQPRQFDSLSMDEKRELRASQGPVWTWNVVATRTRDGMVVPRRENLVDIPKAQMWSAHSKIYVATRQDILSTVVLFDAKEVGGLTTTQLADYATMRSFAADFSAYPETAKSILALFDGAADKPAELTGTDLAFLEGLNSGLPNLPARVKHRQLEQELASLDE